jgi:hypothetical protein
MAYRKRIAPLICLAISTATLARGIADAPALAQNPARDLCGLYFFRSYETGRENFATIILNFHPAQTSAAAPGYFPIDTAAYYEIYIDRNGDAVEDTTLRFQFSRSVRNDALILVGNSIVEIPFAAEPTISESDDSFAFVKENYSIIAIDGDRDDGFPAFVFNASTPTPTTGFSVPLPDPGQNRIPDYASYAESRIFDISLPGTATLGRVFAGQRREPLAANWGELFDRSASTGITGPGATNANTFARMNVTSIALELPIDWLLGDSLDNVVGVWAAVRVPDGQNDFQQVARIGNPLFNELFIGISQKDFFNTVEPADDATLAFIIDDETSISLLDSIRNPAWPELLAQAFAADGLIAPNTPRNDLDNILLRGTSILSNPGEAAADILRCNLLLPERPAASQDPLGFIAGDVGGFPNGRRPGDDVVDILLNLANGVELDQADAPSNHLQLTDGVAINGTFFADTFPYLNAPFRPSPHDGSVNVIVESTDQLSAPFAIDPPETVAEDGSGILIQTQGDTPKHFYRARIDRPGTQLGIEQVDDHSTTLRIRSE